MDFFSDDMRRDPYPLYRRMRVASPVFHVPRPWNAWLIFDYEGAKRVLGDAETFSSAMTMPRNWFMFRDPPQHTKSRALISKAFTPAVVANLEPRVRELSRQILDEKLVNGEMDVSCDYSIPLPLRVIAQLLGIPDCD